MAQEQPVTDIVRRTIERDIAARTAAHQAAMAGLRAVSAAAARPLALLAHGDSWFDYPLSGNDLSLSRTDVVAQLPPCGQPAPLVLNLSHYGDATTTEMSLPKQRRLIAALRDGANWDGAGKPDAILFSGGGDDVAGDQFCIFLDRAAQAGHGIDPARFAGVLGLIEASYRDLFALRDRLAPGVPVIGHCYDFAIPNGVHPMCAGPWLKPSLDFCGWSVDQGTVIVRHALTRFRATLGALAADPANRFVLVDTQGTLAPADWANELHPYPAGFKKVAEVVVMRLRALFPGRI